jgi:hypothetical protein
MLEKIKIENIIFIDIETVPQYCDAADAPESIQNLWEKKAKFLVKQNEIPSDIYQKAGIYAEFGKIICISIGLVITGNKEQNFRVKSFYGDDEKKLLQEFIELLNEKFKDKKYVFCAHNGKEFDYPYIARRILINELQLPEMLDLAGKKPWEVPHLDTLELWKFGDYKSYTSLELLAFVFGIKTPKDDIDGSQVADVYWKEKNLKRIVIYCQKDIVTLALVLLKLKGIKQFLPEQISYAEVIT